MQVGTFFEIEDLSDIPSMITVPTNVVKPLLMCAFTSDKGKEEPTFIEGKAFFEQYGSISFENHGQPLLQAAYSANSGGRLYCKRIVAPDSKLAHLCLSATVEQIKVQAKNATGELLYTDNITGKETTSAQDSSSSANQPKMVDGGATIKYDLTNIPSVTGNDVNAIVTQFKTTVNAGNTDIKKTFPLFVFADTGRGLSNKKIKITPDYNSSRVFDFTRYTFEIIENNTTVESMVFTFNPDIIYKSKNISLKNMIKENSSQVRCYSYDGVYTEMIDFLVKSTGLDEMALKTGDLLFCKTIKGQEIPKLTLHKDSVLLNNIYGIALIGGENGSFGTKPIAASGYEAEMVKFFNGTITDEIYDVDNIQLDAIIDANYPESVKKAIEGLVAFRQDALYFRDLGFAVTSMDELKLVAESTGKSIYTPTYLNFWDIIDPYTRKQITVTIGYSLVRPFINHFINGRTRPFAGIRYGVTFPEVIEGTVNFIPKVTPSVNQKLEVGDLRINYATAYDNLMTMETLYTSQERYTQLSFLNNVMAVQEVMKAIRIECPKLRYSWIDGEDLEKYKEDVQKVINRYSSNFAEISMEYIRDAKHVANKIFYAAIKVKFRDFEQTEYFKITALPTN